MEAESGVDEEDEIDHPAQLFFHLVGPADDVGVILSEAAHSHQAGELALLLIAVDSAAFGVAQRQLTVGVGGVLVDADMEGAVHGFQEIGLGLLGGLLVLAGLQALAGFQRRIHAVVIEIPVAGSLPEVLVADVRCPDQTVASRQVGVVPEVLYQPPEDGAFGMPEGQPQADELVDMEEVQVLADLAVVPVGGFGQKPQVISQFLLAVESQAVDAGQHLVLLAAAPVGAGQLMELEAVGRDGAGRVHVGPAAEVGEIADRVIADGLFALSLEIPNQFGFVDFAGGGLGLQGGLDLFLLAAELEVSSDQFRHPFFQGGQVAVADFNVAEVDVVVETGGDHRPDGQFGRRPSVFDGRGQEMGQGMALGFQTGRGRIVFVLHMVALMIN